jgi:hypothetical protein
MADSNLPRPRRRIDRWELDEIRAAQDAWSRALWGCAVVVILAVIGLSLWAARVPSGPPVYNMPYSVNR